MGNELIIKRIGGRRGYVEVVTMRGYGLRVFVILIYVNCDVEGKHMRYMKTKKQINSRMSSSSPTTNMVFLLIALS